MLYRICTSRAVAVQGTPSTVTVQGALFLKEQTVAIEKKARYQPCLGRAKSAADLKTGTFIILFTAERDGRLVAIDLAEDKPEKEKAAKAAKLANDTKKK